MNSVANWLIFVLAVLAVSSGLAALVRIREKGPKGFRQSAGIFGVVLLGLAVVVTLNSARLHAATNQGSGLVWERELGRQKITPTSSTALTIPAGTKHAEIHIDGGDVLVTWNGGAPVDSATGAMKWPDGHFRKEENDGPKLSNLRLLCASCTVWVDYFGDRR